MVVAAMLLSAPTRPLSRTAAAISSREGAAVVEGDRPASSLDAAMALDLLKVLTGTIVDNPHRGEAEKKMFVCENQNYLKNKVKLKELKR
jgi:hypothetical protein